MNENFDIKRIVIYSILGSICIAALSYLLFSLYPSLEYLFKYKDKEYYPYVTTVVQGEEEDNAVEVIKDGKPIPKENRIVIPTTGIDVEIVEGSGEWALDKGAWHKPHTGDPVNGGNFVVTGHRFGFGWLPSDIRKKSNFYNLDKVEIGDKILVYWEGKEYVYQITEVKSVPNTAIEIENPSAMPKITVYTCSLLGRDYDRLVLIGKPV